MVTSAEALHTLSAIEAAQRIRAGEITAEALTAACLARIEEREREVGSWEYIDFERALKRARAADQLPPVGLLHGIPIAVKDIIDTYDMPTGLGSHIYRERRPAWDAACIALLRAAGAIVLGKTVTTELAYFQPGKTRNPHNLERTPGGSSSGSAAAVADYMVPLGLGTQTAASITRPASFCGVVGYKGSHGFFTLAGIKSFAESLDSLGVFGRSVEDIALVQAVLQGEAVPECGGSEEAPLRIGICRTPEWDHCEPSMRAAVERAAERLVEAGGRLGNVNLPTPFESLADTQKIVMAYEASRNYAHERRMHWSSVSEPLQALLEEGQACSRERYLAAKTHAAKCRGLIETIFAEYDALLAPSAPGEAPKASQGTGDPLFSRMWTLLWLPSISVPVLREGPGMPLGVQFLGPYGRDRDLLRVAAWAARRLSH